MYEDLKTHLVDLSSHHAGGNLDLKLSQHLTCVCVLAVTTSSMEQGCYAQFPLIMPVSGVLTSFDILYW